MAAPQLPSFTDFPTEIQELVWNAAAQKRNLIHATLTPQSGYIMEDPITFQPTVDVIALTPEIAYIATPAPPGELLLANKLANDRVQELYHIVKKDDSQFWKCKDVKKAGRFTIKDRFYTNFHSDTFYFELHNGAQSIANTLLPATEDGDIPDAPEIFSEIRHLAIALDMEVLKPSVPDIAALTLGAGAPQPFSIETALDGFLHDRVLPSIDYFPKLKTLTFVVKQATGERAINWGGPAPMDIGGIIKLELKEWLWTINMDARSGLSQKFPLNFHECERVEAKLREWFEVMKVFNPDSAKIPEVELKLGSVRGLYQKKGY